MSDAWGAVSSVGKGLFGSDANEAYDKSNWEGKDFTQHHAYNPNAGNLGGGDAGYAEALARTQDDLDRDTRARGEAAQGRLLTEDAGLSGLEGQSRGEQTYATQLARGAAEGTAPSAAMGQLQNGMNRSAAAASGMAGGARGGAALALAQGNAQAGTAMANQGASNDAAMLRANEMAQARGLYGSLSGAQRGMDQSRLQQNSQMQQFNRTANDQYDVAMQGAAIQRGQLGQQARQAQQQGALQQQQMVAQSDDANQARGLQKNLYNTEAVKGRMGAIGGMLGSGANVAVNAAGK